MMPNEHIQEILHERNKTHGNFADNALRHSAIYNVLYKALATKQGLGKIHPNTYACMILALQMISNKLSRIATGDPNEVDHWEDIAGYATLVARELKANGADSLEQMVRKAPLPPQQKLDMRSS